MDLVGRRERYLKSNFESLSGTEHEQNNNKLNKSISNQYRESGAPAVVASAMQRNARTIARAQSFRDEEQNRKREELQRRIEETRKKLQNVSRPITILHMSKISSVRKQWTHIASFAYPYDPYRTL